MRCLLKTIVLRKQFLARLEEIRRQSLPAIHVEDSEAGAIGDQRLGRHNNPRNSLSPIITTGLQAYSFGSASSGAASRHSGSSTTSSNSHQQSRSGRSTPESPLGARGKGRTRFSLSPKSANRRPGGGGSVSSGEDDDEIDEDEILGDRKSYLDRKLSVSIRREAAADNSSGAQRKPSLRRPSAALVHLEDEVDVIAGRKSRGSRTPSPKLEEKK